MNPSEINDPLDFDRTVDASGKDREGSRFQSGDMLGQYRIVRLLGRGGMGEVYEAEHTTLGLHYALKLLPPDLMSRPGALERFRREARVMANLKHPHIVQVDDFGETEGQYWLRMELMEGVGEADTGFRSSGVAGTETPPVGGAGSPRSVKLVSLADLAEAGGGKVEQSLLAEILRQVIEGLYYAHKHGAVHRDLKPANVLLQGEAGKSRDEKGVAGKGTEEQGIGGINAKISDFGLVRLVGEEWVMSRAEDSVRLSMSLGEKGTVGDDKGGTSTRALLGTYEYMSPEQKKGEDADARSDIYSLGLIVYKLLTGRDLGLKMPSQIDRDLVKGWDELVVESLEQYREERLSNCEAFSSLLRKVEQELKAKKRERYQSYLEKEQNREKEKREKEETERKNTEEERGLVDEKKRERDAAERRRKAEEENRSLAELEKSREREKVKKKQETTDDNVEQKNIIEQTPSRSASQGVTKKMGIIDVILISAIWLGGYFVMALFFVSGVKDLYIIFPLIPIFSLVCMILTSRIISVRCRRPT